MNLGNRRITNDELCRRFEDLGFTDVAAFLASGNVVFTVPDDEGADPERLARRIAEGLEAALDYPVPTFLRSADEVRALAAHEPFPAGQVEASDGKLQVALLASSPAKADREAALALATGDDRLALGERELWWLPAGRLTDSELDLGALEKRLGDWTMRTANTVRRMAAKFF
jgi:uncharacterized protein (DUF1697 family)